MKLISTKILSVLTISLLLVACGGGGNTSTKDQGPRAVYDQFSSELNAMESLSTKPLNKYLSKRAAAKMSEGFSKIETLPKENRKPLEKMALAMLKDTTTWIDPNAATLDMADDSASLNTTYTDGDNTIITKILFKNESGWKIDVMSKNSESSDGKTKFGESVFD